MRRVALFVSLLIFCWVGNAAFAQEKVRAEGMATIHGNFQDIARDKALENAQRNAVEKAMGVMISSSSEVENYQLKMDRILSESTGYIRRYTILSEKREGDAYRVEIEAEVGVDRLKDRMMAVNLIMSRKAKPRLMVVFSGQEQKDAVAETVIARYALAKGFRLVDTGVVKRDRGKAALRQLAADRKSIVALAQRYGGEVIILGDVETATNSFTLSGIEMHSNKAVVSLKVINVDTGDVIATDSESVSAPGMKGDVKGVIEDAAGKLAKKMTERILARWSSELANTMMVTLVVTGLHTYQSLLGFKEQLKSDVKGLREVYQRTYAGGRADMEIEIRGNAQGLADDIAAMNLRKGKIRIVGITQNKVEAAVLP